jgi:hypothetical protein
MKQGTRYVFFGRKNFDVSSALYGFFTELADVFDGLVDDRADGDRDISSVLWYLQKAFVFLTFSKEKVFYFSLKSGDNVPEAYKKCGESHLSYIFEELQRLAVLKYGYGAKICVTVITKDEKAEINYLM